MTELSAEAREWLLHLARDAIVQSLRGSELEAGEVPAGADSLRGCFVSLHRRDGALRGCIGTFSEGQPLWHAVVEMAVAAAMRDPRFPPTTVEEMEDCVVEISALTPCQPAGLESIEVGRDGICVERGLNRGVLLPQVATDHGWDRDTFLSQTCVKANLPSDAWRDGSVTIETFMAEVFSETA